MHVLRWTLAIALLTMGPGATVGAHHLSVGGQDSVGVTWTESPADPSISSADRQRGLRHPCHEPAGRPEDTRDELLAEAAEDPLCGRLLYHPGTDFAQASPPDQSYPYTRFEADGTDYHDLRFDVVLTQYVGTFGAWSCLPWCATDPGRATYELAHDSLYEAGLTEDDGEDAWTGDRGSQTYNADLHLPHAIRIAEDASGAGDLDGWRPASGDVSFVGFLEGARTTGWGPIDGEELRAMVLGLQSQGTLPEQTRPKVCGFTPEVNLSAPGRWDPGCEIEFRWVGPDDDASGSGRFGSPCSSPAYVCGMNRPAWHAKVVCGMGTGTCRLPSEVHDPRIEDRLPVHRRPDLEDPLPPRPADSTTDHRIWHFVVAPTPSSCNGAQEPGFRPWVYLAHDLDIYTPPGQRYHHQNVVGPQDIADAATGRLRVQVLDAWERASEPVWATDQVEPNADPIGSWADTSGTYLRVDRANTSACLALPGTPETSATVDPWIDLLDSRAEQIAVEALIAGRIGADGRDPGLSQPSGSPDARDARNHGGPSWLTLSGKVGIFTDRDDDGTYRQAPPDRLWDGVQAVGAYPLFWDMWLDEDGYPHAREGCSPYAQQSLTAPLSGGRYAAPLSQLMDAAGYGPRTGLVQALYLREPTALTHLPSGTVLEQPTGDQIYLFMSQGIRSLYAGGDPERGDPWVIDTVGGLLDALRTYAVETGSPEPPAVIEPIAQIPEPDPIRTRVDAGVVIVEGPTVGLTWENRSDFQPQCGQATGGFSSDWAFTHACGQPWVCRGDTVATLYLYEDGPHNPLTTPEPDGTHWIQPFTVAGEVVGLDHGPHAWVDIDPLDGDPTRSR